MKKLFLSVLLLALSISVSAQSFSWGAKVNVGSPNLKIIQKHKKSTSMTQYTLKDTFLFHIPIEPEQLSTFNHNDSYKQYITTFPIVEDINIPPSIFIFHPYNTLYFLYQEQEKPNVRSLKSALKSDNTERRTTKRVRIKIPRNTRKKH